MRAEHDVQQAVECAIREGWSIEKLLVECREAWMYALSNNREIAEAKWVKYMKPTGR